MALTIPQSKIYFEGREAGLQGQKPQACPYLKDQPYSIADGKLCFDLGKLPTIRNYAEVFFWMNGFLECNDPPPAIISVAGNLDEFLNSIPEQARYEILNPPSLHNEDRNRYRKFFTSESKEYASLITASGYFVVYQINAGDFVLVEVYPTYKLDALIQGF